MKKEEIISDTIIVDDVKVKINTIIKRSADPLFITLAVKFAVELIANIASDFLIRLVEKIKKDYKADDLHIQVENHERLVDIHLSLNESEQHIKTLVNTLKIANDKLDKKSYISIIGANNFYIYDEKNNTFPFYERKENEIEEINREENGIISFIDKIISECDSDKLPNLVKILKTGQSKYEDYIEFKYQKEIKRRR